MNRMHKKARAIVAKIERTDCMPDLGHAGLCQLLMAYSGVVTFGQYDGTYYNRRFDMRAGHWTDTRMMLLALIAGTDAEDFI